MKIDLQKMQKYYPPGYLYRQEWGVLGVWSGISLLYSFSYLGRLGSAYSNLFIYRGEERILMENALMPPFWQLLGNSMAGFGVAVLLLVFLMVWHYVYYYQGTKSIYLIRRIPNSACLPRTCLTAPAAGLVLCGMAAGLLIVLYYGLYLWVTPEQCMAMGQW